MSTKKQPLALSPRGLKTGGNTSLPNAPGADSSPNIERFPARRAEKRHVPSEPALPPAVLGPLQSPIGETAGQWFDRWIVAKEAMGLRCGESYRSTWREHLAPRFALQPLTSIRRTHVRRMMEDLRGRMGPGLEPATIRNIYTCLRSIMTGAVRAGLISESPCRLDPGELPPKRDGERYQRSTHVFNAAELATILTSPEVELVDRAFYGLLATCWMRPGEAVELRWADIDWEAMPLPRIAITRARSGKKIFPTKTGVAREAPVCPLLGDMLRELRDGGWARIVGRAPNRDDLVLARLSAAGAPVYLEKKRQHLRWCRAERALGLRHRWVYDLKAAGMSIAQEHGAPQAVVASISHDPKTVVGGYSRFSWSARCEAVMALYRALSGARQLSLL